MNQNSDPKTRLVDVARDLFAAHGYDGTSVRAITSRAKANLGAITYHFGSKEALYHEVIKSRAEPLADRIAAAAQAPGPPLDRIEAIVRAFFEKFIEHPEIPSLLLRELASGRQLPPPVQRVVQRNLGSIIQVVTDGQRDGSIRAGDPLLLALSVVAQPFHFGIAGRVIAVAAGLDFRDPAARSRVVDHVATTVRHALAA